MNRRILLLCGLSIFLVACMCLPANIFGRLFDTEQVSEDIIQALPGEIDGQIEDLENLGSLLAGEVPENIPLVPERNDDLVSAAGMIFYSTPMTLQEVQDFYLREMEALGWSYLENESIFVQDVSAIFNFQNDSQEAIVTIAYQENKLTVVILVTDRQQP